jgi:hypothetical protein
MVNVTGTVPQAKTAPPATGFTPVIAAQNKKTDHFRLWALTPNNAEVGAASIPVPNRKHS